MKKGVMPSCADRWRRVRKYFPQVSEKAFHSKQQTNFMKLVENIFFLSSSDVLLFFLYSWLET